MTHSTYLINDPLHKKYFYLFTIIGLASSELFVSISSSLLAPTKLGMMEFYKTRFNKLLWPFLFWSIVMVGYRYFDNDITAREAIHKILFFPFQAVEPIYWFVYSICGLYLINPLISPWLKNATQKELQFVILMWFVTLLLPYLNFFAEEPFYLWRGNYYFILTYLGGFIGYLFIGVYLRRYPILFQNKWKVFLLVFSLLILGLIPIIWSKIFKVKTFDFIWGDLSVTSACFVIAIYIFFKNFKFPVLFERWMSIVAKYSFGIYLVHSLVANLVVFKIFQNHRILHPLIETPLITLLILLISLFFVRLISKFWPYSKYIVGV